MVVIPELDASFLAGLSCFIEEFRDLLPATGRLAKLFINPWANDETVADRVSRLNSLRLFFLHNVVADMAGGRGQSILIENRANLARRMIKVARELHLLVPNRRDLRDRAREVGLHGVTHGVELHADFFDLVGRRKSL